MTIKLVYSVKETAELLGVSENSVYRLISAKRLRSVDVGTGKRARTRIRHESIVKFLDASERAA